MTKEERRLTTPHGQILAEVWPKQSEPVPQPSPAPAPEPKPEPIPLKVTPKAPVAQPSITKKRYTYVK